MKQMLKVDGMMLPLLISLIYMKISEGILTNFICHSSIGHTFTLNTIINCWMNIVVKKNKLNFFFDKMKSEY
jgi:hypothetical protein